MKREKMNLCRGWMLAILFLFTFSFPAWGQQVGAHCTDETNWMDPAFYVSDLDAVSRLCSFDVEVYMADNQHGDITLNELAQAIYEEHGYGSPESDEGAILLLATDGVRADGTPIFVDYRLFFSAERQELFFGNENHVVNQLVENLDQYLLPDAINAAAPQEAQMLYQRGIQYFCNFIYQVLDASSRGEIVQDVLADAEPMNLAAAPTTDIFPALDASSRVMDLAGLLAPEEAMALEQRADTLSEQYQCDTLIVTVPGTQGYSVSRFAEQLHQAYSLGYGEEKSCMMLLLATAERDYDLMAYGYGNTVCTDWGKSVMENRFLPFFAQNNYYGGFGSYLDSCEEFLQMAQDGTPFDVNTDPEKEKEMKSYGFFGSLILAWMAAKGITTYLKYQMKNAREKTEAGEYIAADGLHLTAKRDQFLRAEKSRRYAPPPKKKGGTSINRGGYSHRSGKY